MPIKKHIPNFLTLINLLCGCIAIVFAFQFKLDMAAYMVGIAALLDFLDGFAARILQVRSEIGKQLDSLADMVTFGLVPGIVMFQIINFSFVVLEISEAIDPEQKIVGFEALKKINTFFSSGLPLLVTQGNGIPFLAFLIPVFSALRLAKFNTDLRQEDSFIGLPTPANAILICSLPLLASEQFDMITSTVFSPFSALSNILSLPEVSGLELFIVNPVVLCLLTVLVSFLLVSPIRLFALKFKSFTWQENKIRYVFLTISLFLLLVFHYFGIPMVIFLYIVLSVINNLIIKKNTA